VSPEAAIELRPPPGLAAPPPFERGWAAGDGGVEPFLSYIDDGGEGVNWSAALEALHEESSRSHPIDVWTRRAALARLGPVAPGSVLMDLGCSTGHLLEDLREAHPQAALIGVDLIAAGLVKAHASVPDARLVQADACRLPIGDASVDGAVSLNLLEHLTDDGRALRELRRVLRPGARAVLVVPAGRRLYDYYDRFLGHARRYARGELAAKARRAGLEVDEDLHLGSLLFPAFALIKGRNRRRYARLGEAEIERRVTSDIAKGRDSGAMRLALRLEGALLRRGVRPPAGIRGLTVARRPGLDP
jgi:SAM-dependent methyltransferase